MTTDGGPALRCACQSVDEYRCWEMRYGPRDWDVGEVEMDGGPCECPCHDEEDDDICDFASRGGSNG